MHPVQAPGLCHSPRRGSSKRVLLSTIRPFHAASLAARAPSITVAASARFPAMCGRLTLAEEARQLADDLAAQLEDEDAAHYRPRWNVAPTELHWVVRQLTGRRRRLQPSRWGWRRAVKSAPGERPRERLIFNTVSETAFDKGLYRSALSNGRCVVPATGFYEWTGDARDRRPIHFRRRDGRLLLLAALVDERGAFTVLTTAPNAEVRAVHDRMPAIRSEEHTSELQS